MLCEWWGGVNRCSHMKWEMLFLVEATSVTMGVSWSSAGREMGRDVRERPRGHASPLTGEPRWQWTVGKCCGD